MKKFAKFIAAVIEAGAETVVFDSEGNVRDCSDPNNDEIDGIQKANSLDEAVIIVTDNGKIYELAITERSSV